MSVPLPPTDRLDGPNVVDVLAREHRALLALCRELTAADVPARRRRLTQVLVACVTRHVSAEERYLYPAVRAAAPDGHRLADRELGEDTGLLRSCQRLRRRAAGERAS